MCFQYSVLIECRKEVSSLLSLNFLYILRYFQNFIFRFQYIRSFI